MPTVAVSISTPDTRIAEQVVRSYVRPALGRTDGYELTFFGRYADAAAVSGGRVDVRFTGDPDTIREDEVPKLDALTGTHDVESTLEGGDASVDETKFPPAQQEFLDRLCSLAGRINQSSSIPSTTVLQSARYRTASISRRANGYSSTCS